MNRLIIGTLLLLSFFSATSQTEKGNWLIGATSNLGFSSQDNGADDRLNVFAINAGVGSFIIDNLSLSLNFGFSRTSIGDDKVSSSAIGPAVRYYIENVFIGSNYSIFNLKRGDITVSTNEVGFIAGYAIFIGNNIALEPNLNYLTRFGGDFDESTDSFGMEMGFNLYF